MLIALALAQGRWSAQIHTMREAFLLLHNLHPVVSLRVLSCGIKNRQICARAGNCRFEI